MEQNLQILPKRVWSMLRIFYFMLRKGISKKKLWLDLNTMMKRAKIVGKAFQNLMFHHHHHIWASFSTNHPRNDSNHHHHHLSFPSPPADESDFSCTASPLVLSPSHKSNNKAVEGSVDMMAFNAAVLKAMEAGSPALPGFGRSPMVRQLRITDSPFPVSSEDNHVDEAAEQFISRFYNNLRQQNSKASFS